MGNESVAKPVGTQVREEDSFDLAAVDAWLKQNVSGLVGTPEVRQLVGGASNLTYLLDYDNRRVVLRRPPVGKKAASAHDMQREFRVQQALRPVFPYVPEMLAYCGDTSIVGSDFYVMEFLDGTVLRAKTAKDEGLDEQTTRAICLSAIDRLVDLHGIDPAAAGLADLGKGDGYVGRQVAGWSKRYGDAHTWNVPSMKKVMRWLDANQPADVATCIIHNDFRIDNLVLDPADLTRVQGVLDWEMATLGDPLMDLGGAMAYWIQADDPGYMQRARIQPSDLPGMLTRKEIVDYYCQQTGRTVDNWVFYEVFGLFRTAAIIQQIYYRYHHKQTHNPAFKHFWIMVHALGRRCSKLIAEAS